MICRVLAYTVCYYCGASICCGADILYAIYLLVGMFIEAAQVKYLAQCLTGDIEPAALLYQVQFPNHNQFAPLKDEVSGRVVLCIPHRQWSILCLISCCSMSLTDVTCIPPWWLDPWLRLQFPYKISSFLLTHKTPSPPLQRKKREPASGRMSEGGRISEVILKDDIASLCAVIPSLTNVPHLSWWHAPLYKWVTSEDISYVSHNALRHLLSTFTCNET